MNRRSRRIMPVYIAEAPQEQALKINGLAGGVRREISADGAGRVDRRAGEWICWPIRAMRNGGSIPSSSAAARI